MMGLRGIPETELHFENCRVPRANLLTIGFRQLMEAYNAQRCGAGTVALGIAQGAQVLSSEDLQPEAQQRESLYR